MTTNPSAIIAAGLGGIAGVVTAGQLNELLGLFVFAIVGFLSFVVVEWWLFYRVSQNAP